MKPPKVSLNIFCEVLSYFCCESVHNISKNFLIKKVENQNMNGNFKINPRGSHNLFELNKLICRSNYFKNTNTLPAVYSQRWRNKVASTLICIIFEKAPYTTPYKPPALHNGVKTYLKSQLIISYYF